MSRSQKNDVRGNAATLWLENNLYAYGDEAKTKDGVLCLAGYTCIRVKAHRQSGMRYESLRVAAAFLALDKNMKVMLKVWREAVGMLLSSEF